VLCGLHVLADAENDRSNLIPARDRPAAEKCEARLNKLSTSRVEQGSLWPMNNEGKTGSSVPVKVQTSDRVGSTKLLLPSQMYRVVQLRPLLYLFSLTTRTAV
jgi:hypothetical protein